MGNPTAGRAGLGAWIEEGSARFRVWAPTRESVELVLDAAATPVALEKQADGSFTGVVPRVEAGRRYRYRVDGKGPFPDPASRFQPEGVHGPSEIVDPTAFEWNDSRWPGLSLDDLVLYELHVGTFTA